MESWLQTGRLVGQQFRMQKAKDSGTRLCEKSTGGSHLEILGRVIQHGFCLLEMLDSDRGQHSM